MSAWIGISAQADAKTAKQFSIGIEIFSTTGAGLELAKPLNSNFALRGGISLLPIRINHTFNTSIDEGIKLKIDEAVNREPSIEAALRQRGLPVRAQDISTDIDAKATLGLINGKILFDYYPSAKRSFYLTGGFYIGKSELIAIQGSMNQVVDVLNVLKEHGLNYFDEIYVIDQEKGYQLSGYDITNVKGALEINSVKPYIGLGFGRAVPKRRVGVRFELGAFYHGTPRLTSTNINLQKFIDDELAEITTEINQWPIYPVISLKVNFRVF
jgi:hypothetical protein